MAVRGTAHYRSGSGPVDQKAQDKQYRHMGPMAQDFRDAFGLGEDERHISTVDADGVALAAIQGLHRLLRDKDAKLRRQQFAIDELKAKAWKVDILERKLAAIESRLGLR